MCLPPLQASHISSPSLPLTCTFFYQATKLVIVLLILLVFIALSKWYKLRVREEVVDIHNIVSEIYAKYLKQAELQNDPGQQYHDYGAIF